MYIFLFYYSVLTQEDVDEILIQNAVVFLNTTLSVMDRMYKRQYAKFYATLDPNESRDKGQCNFLLTVQKAVEFFTETHPNEKILMSLFKLIEHIHGTFEIIEGSLFYTLTFEWLLGYCKKNEFKHKDLAIANKILLNISLRYREGNFYTNVALALTEHFDHTKETKKPLPLVLKSIANAPEKTLIYLCDVMEKELSYVEYFLKKCKSILDKVSI
jgi:hypothetical protein